MTQTITDQLPSIFTLRELARVVGKPVWQLNYALDVYDVQPRRRAGIVRLFDRDQLPEILAALSRVANR